jgi:preprotein translocase subunit SecD
MIGRRLSALLIATVACVTTALVVVGCGGGTTRHNTSAAPGVEIVLQAVPTNKRVTAEDLDSAVSIMRNRSRALGVSGAEIRKQEPNQIVIQLPGIRNPTTASKLIGQTGQLELYDLEGDLHSPSINVQGAPVAFTSRYALLAPVQGLAKTSGTPTQFFLYGKKKILLAGPSDTRAGLFTSQHPKLLPGERVFEVSHGTVVITCGGPKSQAVICPGNADPSVVNYYLFFHRPELTGKDLNAGGIKQDFDTNGLPIVRLSFSSHGDHVFQAVTRQLYQRGQLRKARSISRSSSITRSRPSRRSTTPIRRSRTGSAGAARSPASALSARRRTSRSCSRPVPCPSVSSRWKAGSSAARPPLPPSSGRAPVSRCCWHSRPPCISTRDSSRLSRTRETLRP